MNNLTTDYRNQELYDASLPIAEALKSSSIKAIALAGVSNPEIKELKPDNAWLAESDIALLVQQKDAAAALEALKIAGFKLVEQAESSNDCPFQKTAQFENNGVAVAIYTLQHESNNCGDTAYANTLQKQSTNIYQLSEQDLFSRAEPLASHSPSLYAPELHDFILLHCIHTYQLIYNRRISAETLSANTNLLTSPRPGLNWDILMDRSNTFQCERAFINLLWAAKNSMDVTLPEEIKQGLTDWTDPEFEKKMLNLL